MLRSRVAIPRFTAPPEMRPATTAPPPMPEPFPTDDSGVEAAYSRCTFARQVNPNELACTHDATDGGKGKGKGGRRADEERETRYFQRPVEYQQLR